MWPEVEALVKLDVPSLSGVRSLIWKLGSIDKRLSTLRGEQQKSRRCGLVLLNTATDTSLSLIPRCYFNTVLVWCYCMVQSEMALAFRRQLSLASAAV